MDARKAQISFLLIFQGLGQSHSRKKEIIELVEDSRRQLCKEIDRSHRVEEEVSKGVKIAIVVV